MDYSIAERETPVAIPATENPIYSSYASSPYAYCAIVTGVSQWIVSERVPLEGSRASSKELVCFEASSRWDTDRGAGNLPVESILDSADQWVLCFSRKT